MQIPQNLGLLGNGKEETKALSLVRCLVFIFEGWFLVLLAAMNSLWLKKSTDIFLLCLVFSGSQALQPWKSILKLWGEQQNFSDSSKLCFLEKNLPTPLRMQGTEYPVPRKSKGLLKCFQLFWSSRQEERLGFLLTMSGCAWGTEYVFGEAGQFLRSETEFIKMSVHISPALLLDTIFWSFCHTVIPFIQFGALVGKTQERDVTELLMLKDELDAILLKLESV